MVLTKGQNQNNPYSLFTPINKGHFLFRTEYLSLMTNEAQNTNSRTIFSIEIQSENPSSSKITIEYELRHTETVSIIVYNHIGEKEYCS